MMNQDRDWGGTGTETGTRTGTGPRIGLIHGQRLVGTASITHERIKT